MGDPRPRLSEAIAHVAAPGELFEVAERDAGGHAQRHFVNAPASLCDIFDAARGVDEVFLVYEGEEWTFAEVMRRADELGDALVSHFGVTPGSRVALAMANRPEWVIAFAAVGSVGAVVVSLNAWWTAPELDFALSDADVSVVIADPERVDRVLAGCRSRGVPVVVARGDESRPAPDGSAHWVDVVLRGARASRVDVRGDWDATILYTSGTTGRPKGAVSTHDAIVQSLMAFSAGLVIETHRHSARDHEPTGPRCLLLSTPLFHVTGCVPVMLSCFAWRFRLVMMRRWDPALALTLIERHRVTNVVGVPTQSWDLVNLADVDAHDTSSLVTVGGGGAPAPTALVRRVEATFSRARPNLAFGMTETNAYGPQNYGDDFQARPTSTGQTPTIVMDVEIRDPSGRSMPPHQVGEIWVSGPTLFRGYWRQPEATAQVLRDGWLRTGDIGHLDEEGFLYVEDRVHDVILRGGMNVYGAEVESALYEHPAVLEVAVCGLPDERLGESVAAVVVVREGRHVSEETLRVFARERLAHYKVPTRIALTTERLELSATGKVVKTALASRYFRSVT